MSVVIRSISGGVKGDGWVLFMKLGGCRVSRLIVLAETSLAAPIAVDLTRMTSGGLGFGWFYFWQLSCVRRSSSAVAWLYPVQLKGGISL